VKATAVTLADGEVVILPGEYQLVPGRPVIGVSFQVRDLEKARRTLFQDAMQDASASSAEGGTAGRVVIAPESAHGLWLEFRGGS
jgi:hypothetical protein